MDAPTLRLDEDPTVRATVTARRPLRYDAGADVEADRPAHVRAGSALVPTPRGLLVVQDDAHWLARVDGPRVEAIALPRGPGGLRLFGDDRRNKPLKPDLEAGCALPDGRALVLGSGSTALRERVVVVGPDDGVPRILEAPSLYAAIREVLVGARLNVEGACLVGDALRLLHRGNGQNRGESAWVDVPLADVLALLDGDGGWPTASLAAVLHLGEVGGVRLTPTDLMLRDGRAWMPAAAEDTPDVVLDGAVAGSAIAWVEGDRGAWARLYAETGAPSVDKIEGIAPGARADELLLVTDVDDTTAPAELLTVRLSSVG